ncbi:MAG: imidazole glycerol phosphate synthase, glutamine amidotransferase subunit [Desulfovibrionales bacterium GWA2_65_9]|nr:MAG: imidazole glycerol phosphate synthase, glutamine amidotransferase subunit [Desulfovibrionales bacterium GWA2_65_9]
MRNIAIIDYGLCNLDSVVRAVEICGAQPLPTRTPEDLEEADGLILPGVGAFPDAMAGLEQQGFVEPLRRLVLDQARPFLGICLGMQLMAEYGVEGGERAGLGLVPGKVVRLLPDAPGTRVPHVGWNEVHHLRPCPLFEGIPTGRDFYFVHSYHFAAREDHILATTPYCGSFASVVGRGTLFGTQFHPEKSLADGLKTLRNFIALC